MPCPHNEITIVQRSQRQSAVAAAAYQSGEKLFCEYDQQVKHYPEKRGIVHNEILLPANAPQKYADRNTLWNAAEAVEKQWNSQLARRWVLTIPREIPPDQYAVLVREFCEQQFVSKGMIADFAIHDPHPPGHNPHAHVLLTMRAMDEHGKCVTATKKGKKFCPDSKGIAEETIEQAFIESYRLLCQNNKDVLDEFIARTEETLSDSNASKQLAKVEKDIAALDAKRAKLVDMRLEEIIDKDTYEQKYFDLSSQIEQLQKQRESLQESAETDSTMKKRIAEFRRTLEENEVLDTFDRYVFESIVEKVIVGGYDEDGNKDPSMLTFIYKTGFKSSLDGTNFKPPRKNSKAAKQSAGLCSHTTDEAKSMCSYHSDDTCGDGCLAFQG